MSLVVPPTQLDLTIYQGASWTLPLRWEYGPDENDTAPVDLTGASARSQMRQRHSSAACLFSLTSAPDGGIVLGDDAGTIELTLTASQTAALPVGSAVWDLEIVFPDAVVCRLVEGVVTVDPEVTR